MPTPITGVPAPRPGSPEAFDIRVRPALDSPGAALDRAKMWIYQHFAEYGLPCPVTGHPSTMGGAAQQAAAQQQAQAQQQQQQQPSAS